MRLRLISDVPVGTFCSGGVDSSLVTALAARLKGEPVNTFSVGFDEDGLRRERATRGWSPSTTAPIHHQLRVGNVEYAELFPRMVWHNDEPLDFANSVHIFALSELAKRHVTVVLTGEGSDELFAGYPRYRIPGPGAVVPARARAACAARSACWFTIIAWQSWIAMQRARRSRRCSTTRAICGPDVVREALPAHERLRARRSGRTA